MPKTRADQRVCIVIVDNVFSERAPPSRPPKRSNSEASSMPVSLRMGNALTLTVHPDLLALNTPLYE